MKKLFVPYELAVIAKEKGFNEPCLAFHFNEELLELIDNPFKYPHLNEELIKYSNSSTCSAPLYQKIVDWLREEHNIHISIKCWDNLYSYIITKPTDKTFNFYSQIQRTDYYLNLQDAIKEAFKLI